MRGRGTDRERTTLVRSSGTFVLLLALALVPVFATRTLPLYDYPNHLARMHVLMHWQESPDLQRYYRIHWAAIPNLAMDLVVPMLGRVLPFELAGKVFIALTFLLLSGGTVLLHYAIHRRLSLYPLVAFLFLYNLPFLFGFMNYLFSAGFYLVLFAFWILAECWPWGWRVLVFSLLATVLYFLHLYGLGLYGLSVVTYEASRSVAARRVPWRDWAVTLGQFTLPVLIFLLLSPTAEAHGQTRFDDWLNKWFYWHKPFFFFDLLDNYDGPVDIGTATVIAGATVAGLVGRMLVMERRLMLTVAALFLAFVFMPTNVFSSWAADMRCPVALILLCIASTDWRWHAVAAARMAAVAVFALFLLRMGIITQTWAGYDRLYDQYRAAFATLPEGVRLTAAIAYPSTRSRVMRRPSLLHLGNLVVIARDGFYPCFFANPRQQPVLLKPPYDALAARYDDTAFFPDALTPEAFRTGRNPFDETLLAHYDYMLIVREKLFPVPLPSNLVPVYRGTDFRLFKIEPADHRAPPLAGNG